MALPPRGRYARGCQSAARSGYREERTRHAGTHRKRPARPETQGALASP